VLKVAVIGLGKMGQRHLENWSQLDDIQIAGLVGSDQKILTSLSSKYNTQGFSRLEDLFAGVEVDVVDICLPTFLHYQFVREAALANKHVICEKPIGRTVSEAQAIIDICQKQNVQLYIGHTLRFDPEYANAHDQVMKGVIGNPGVVRLSRGTATPVGKKSWYADPEKSGGMILDLGIHDIDWLLWTFGSVQRVMAKHIKRELPNGKNLEYALVTLRMVDGTIAHLELSWAKKRLETSFELAGKNGMITSNSVDSQPIVVIKEDESLEPTYLSNNLVGDSPILRQLRHFKDCIVEGFSPIVTAEDALKAVEVAEAAIQSAATSKPVTIVERRALQ